MAALGLLLAIAPLAWAEGDCQSAFEKWVKLSSERLRVAPQSGRGACIPTEAVREELLADLARTRGLCAETSSDQSVRRARTLLNINQSFIASLVACPSGTADSADGWVTKSAPPPEKPKVAAPPPAPEKPKVAPPSPAPEKPKVAAPLTPPPAAAPPPSPPCLEITPAKDEHYSLINRRCQGHAVLAVVETRGAGGETVCRGYTISQSLAIRAPRHAPPRVNFECVLSDGPCNTDRLSDMFPECDW